ncbi:hypothetical protein G7Y89_g7282 [Cudoniella acicularis]|uniref:Heterokaryon incompatibility domain-containing protein n=1 Tax=Cudoniella acicularis TaxID=354080 RepID=A0A8H4RL76_9HELO|nr:hypothetical protein G7Y89_g7282 [Cudoniella acicularis]
MAGLQQLNNNSPNDTRTPLPEPNVSLSILASRKPSDNDTTHQILCRICLSSLSTALSVFSASTSEFKIGSSKQHHSFHSFKAAVQNDCQICSTLWKHWACSRLANIGRTEQDLLSRPNAIYTTCVIIQGDRLREFPEDVRISVGVCDNLEGPRWFGAQRIDFEFNEVNVELNTDVDGDGEEGKILMEDYRPEREMLSQASVELMRYWLRCCEKHEYCRQLKQSHFTPTRLLDLGLDEGTELKYIRLAVFDHQAVTVAEPSLQKGPRFIREPWHEGKGNQSESSEFSEGYLTLSHCWGTAKNIKLLQNNITSFQHQINMKDLPKTFAEAVRVTRLLGFRYLWIDSLCIIQDSIEDWDHESALMSSIYKYAACNLAAAGASDSAEGLLVQRNRGLVSRARVRLQFANGEGGRCKEFYVTQESEIWMDQFDDEPLYRRAWVIQERLLARRTIHFGTTQLQWDCEQKIACETYPLGLPCELQDIRKGRFPITLQQDIREKRSSLGRDWNAWNRVVERYSRCLLTVPSDKLVALSGIVKDIQEFTERQNYHTGVCREYFAGIWKHELHLGLLWAVKELEVLEPLGAKSRDNKSARSTPTHSYRAKEYRAPSWSWASVEGAIVVDYFKIHCKGVDLVAWIEDIQIRTARLSSSQVIGGFLKINVYYWKLLLDTKLDPEVALERRKFFITGLEVDDGRKYPIFEAGGRAVLDEQLDTIPRTVYFFRICWDKYSEVSSTEVKKGKGTIYYGLLLGGNKDGTFYRVGVCDVLLLNNTLDVILNNSTRRTVTII